MVKAGVKPSIVISVVISVVGSICYLFIEGNDVTIPIMTTAIKMGLSAEAYIAHYVPGILFPPIFRGTAIGFSGLLGSLISIAGP